MTGPLGKNNYEQYIPTFDYLKFFLSLFITFQKEFFYSNTLNLLIGEIWLFQRLSKLAKSIILSP